MQFEKIRQLMNEFAASTTAEVGLAFLDRETGLSHTVNGDKQIPACSMFKIWLLLALFKMAERGQVSLEEEWPFAEGDKSRGSGILASLRPGFSMQLWNYVYLMMAHSDNSTTDKVLRFVTADRVRKEVLKPLDLAGTTVEVSCQEMLDTAYSTANPDGEMQAPGLPSYRMTPFYLGKTANNLTTPNDVLKTFSALLDGRILNAEWTQKTVDLMSLCETNSRIPRLLPGKKRLKIAHKTGSCDRICNDGGILFTKKGVYMLVLMYNGNTASEEEYIAGYARYRPDNALAELSKAIYDAYMTP